MPRPRDGVSPGVEALESKELLSTAVPGLTMRTINRVVAQVETTLGKLARTQDTSQASARLDRLASKIPLGTTQLAPSWQDDLALYRPGIAQTVTSAETQILGGLYRDVIRGAQDGAFRVIGPGSTIFYVLSPGQGITGSPAPTSSEDSVQIQNQTNQALTVTIELETGGYQQPTLTMTIPSGNNPYPSMLFDFMSSTGASMEITAINGTTESIQLDQPNPPPNYGYYGETFSISMMGQTYNISPP
jgi:hypothetical protein